MGEPSGESEVLVSISSTKTSLFGSVVHATVTRQAALRHSSRASALTVHFWLKPSRLRTRFS